MYLSKQFCFKEQQQQQKQKQNKITVILALHYNNYEGN